MEMEEESKKLLTINTHKGLFQYNGLLFGVACAPAIWQQAMDQILEGISHVQCILDDMIISGASDQEHLDNLEEVLSRLSQHGLRKPTAVSASSLKKELSSVVMRSASWVYTSPNRKWMLY